MTIENFTKETYTVSIIALLNDWDSGEPEYEELYLAIDDSNQSPDCRWVVKPKTASGLGDLHYPMRYGPCYIERYTNYDDLGKIVRLSSKYDSVDWATAKLIKITTKTVVESIVEET